MKMSDFSEQNSFLSNSGLGNLIPRVSSERERERRDGKKRDMETRLQIQVVHNFVGLRVIFFPWLGLHDFFFVLEFYFGYWSTPPPPF